MNKSIRAAVGLLLVVSASILSACSVPGATALKAKSGSPGSTTSRVRATQSRVIPRTSAAPRAPIVTPNIFAPGVVSHTLKFGAQALTIKYYTVGGPAWDGRAPVPVQFSAHVEGSDGMHTLKISTFVSTFTAGSVTTTVGRDQGPLVITPPFNYGGAFTVPSTRAAIGTVTNEFTLLVETTPTSGQFFRDTVIDTLKLNFAVPASTTTKSTATCQKVIIAQAAAVVAAVRRPPRYLDGHA